MKTELSIDKSELHVTVEYSESINSLFCGRLNQAVINMDVSSLKWIHISMQIPMHSGPNSIYILDVKPEEEMKRIFKRNNISISINLFNKYGSNALVQLSCEGVSDISISDYAKDIHVDNNASIRNLNILSNVSKITVHGFVRWLNIIGSNKIETLEMTGGGKIGKIRVKKEHNSIINQIIINQDSCGIGTMEDVKVCKMKLPVEITTMSELEWFIPEGDVWNLIPASGYYRICINKNPIFPFKVVGVKRPDWLWFR